MLKNGEFAHIVELSSILMTLGVSWSWVTMSVALATSLPGIRWFSRGEILSIVKATLPAVLLDTGIAGTTPSQRLLISTTSSSFGPRSPSAITASTSTPPWLVNGRSHESSTHFLDQAKKEQSGRVLPSALEHFHCSCKDLQIRRTLMDFDRVNRYCDGERPANPSR